ncbi:pyrroline-5-carboxylate reductase [bacterium]
MNNINKIIFIGAGNMAEALIKGIIEKNIFAKEAIHVVDVKIERIKYFENQYGLVGCSDAVSLIDENSCVFLSVKPQQAVEVLERIQMLVKNNLVVSIMAGVKIETIKKYLKDANVVRVMPNTPCLVGLGAAGISFESNLDDDMKTLILKIMESVGFAVQVNENDLDAVTALSGSGPAYVFYLAEAMIKAGVDMGLSAEISKKLAIQTIYGASSMMKNIADSPENIRAKVTSKGGTTEAAVKSLEQNKFIEMLKSALQEAKKKSMELSDK